jgi:cathepsin O
LVGAEDVILMHLAHHGPVAVAVNAVNWQNYLGGVIQFHCDGGPEHINHAVQIVGYDRSAPIPHYVVRNSWGVEFGHNGYLYIAIGSNLCGMHLCSLFLCCLKFNFPMGLEHFFVL